MKSTIYTFTTQPNHSFILFLILSINCFLNSQSTLSIASCSQILTQ